MMGSYDKLAEDLRGIVDIASMDCTDMFNEPMCTKYRVNGYPTLKFFVIQEVEGKKKKVVLGTLIERSIINNWLINAVLDYHGDRSTDAMTSFIKKHMHKFIFKVSKAVPKALSKWTVNFEAFFSKVIESVCKSVWIAEYL